jgi:hypothetical protein
MRMTLFASGRRLFMAASFAMILVAILHTIGNTLSSPSADSAYVSLEAAMRAYTVPLGMGMVPSVWDIYRGLVFTMSICLAAMGALGIVIGASREATPALLSRIALTQAIASAALTVLYVVYQITPALISMAVVTLLFAVAVRSSR